MTWTGKFISDLVDVPSEWWAHWIFAKPSDGLPDKSSLIGGRDQPILSKRARMFSRLWTTVRPGWKVQPVACDDPALRTDGDGQGAWVMVDLVGFESPKADRSAMVIRNHDGPRLVRIRGLHGRTATAWCTGRTDDDTKVGTWSVVSGEVLVPCADQSVTIVASDP